MGVCVHRHSVDCNEQVNGIDIRIDPMWPAAVKMYRLDDQVITEKDSGNGYLPSEEPWVNARNLEAPAPSQSLDSSERGDGQISSKSHQFLWMPLQWDREPTRFVKASEIFGDLPCI